MGNRGTSARSVAMWFFNTRTTNDISDRGVAWTLSYVRGLQFPIFILLKRCSDREIGLVVFRQLHGIFFFVIILCIGSRRASVWLFRILLRTIAIMSQLLVLWNGSEAG
jgi:hypothetical protein